MYDKRAETRAAKLGILDKMQALEKELLEIEGISDIEFDLDNYPDLHQVILIPRYEVGAYKYRSKRPVGFSGMFMKRTTAIHH